MAAVEHTSRIQFHASATPLEEFTHAPVIHVGTKAASKALIRDREIFAPDERRRGFKTHALAFSQHAQFHDEVLGDDEANEAHARFLEKRGIPLSTSVSDSRMSPIGKIPLEQERRVNAAVRALTQNKIVSYENRAEDEGSISHIVPTPYLNMRTRGKKDPQKQPVLPMDYSGMEPSERTRQVWW